MEKRGKRERERRWKIGGGEEGGEREKGRETNKGRVKGGYGIGDSC